MARIVTLMSAAGAVCLFASTAEAQWQSQTLSLVPGWNAVYFEVQPEPRSCDVIFSNAPVESVWGWNRRFSSVQFIQEANTLVTPQRDWLVYFPPGDPASAQKTLFSLEGGKCYLIKMLSNAAPVSLTVIGTPSLRKISWLADSFNLVGFAVNPVAPPTFASFFQASPAHATSPIYRLRADGRWLPVSASATTMLSGEAFWIYTTGESSYTGPLQVGLDQSTGLDYGSQLAEQTLRIKNVTSTSINVVVSQLDSLNAPDGNVPALAGRVVLSYWNMNFSSNQFWLPLPTRLSGTILQPGEEAGLRLMVRRRDMPPFAGAVGPLGALYESILDISDGNGSFRYRVPVTAQGLQTKAAQYGIQGLKVRTYKRMDKSFSAYALAGLWVGAASVTNVSQPANANDPGTPVPAASEYQLRLIFHVDGTGHAQLLQRVFELWQPGTYTNNAEGISEVSQPGHYVLVSDEKYLNRFSGATIRDGTAVGRRYSSVSFGFDNAITNLIDGNFGTNLWSCRITNGHNDPTNPFKHVYHPDHNNLAEDYQTPLPEGVKSYTVTRQITLQFTATDPESLAVAGWGDNQIGGIYQETLSGLHRNPIYVSGTFRLRHASAVPLLNDGLTN